MQYVVGCSLVARSFCVVFLRPVSVRHYRAPRAKNSVERTVEDRPARHGSGRFTPRSLFTRNAPSNVLSTE